MVVKSGPGFHHQKTYDFGPDGVETKTEERTSSSDKESGKGFMQDMSKSKWRRRKSDLIRECAEIGRDDCENARPCSTTVHILCVHVRELLL